MSSKILHLRKNTVSALHTSAGNFTVALRAATAPDSVVDNRVPLSLYQKCGTEGAAAVFPPLTGSVTDVHIAQAGGTSDVAGSKQCGNRSSRTIS